MIYKGKKIILSGGEECELRSPTPEDAQIMLDYLKQTADETDFMIRYPEEVTMSLEEEQSFLRTVSESDMSMMISAYISGKLVGNIGLMCISERLKTKHRASIGVAVIKEAWSKGIGTLLLNEVISEAEKIGYEQIELEVIETNTKAFTLYKRLGFIQYGKREHGFKLKDNTYLNELLMIKML